MLRSVFMKGLAAVVLESVTAADHTGSGEWLRRQIAGEFAGDAGQLIDRLIDGSRLHAERRIHEVDDAVDYLESHGQPTWVSRAAKQWLEHLASGAEPGA